MRSAFIRRAVQITALNLARTSVQRFCASAPSGPAFRDITRHFSSLPTSIPPPPLLKKPTEASAPDAVQAEILSNPVPPSEVTLADSVAAANKRKSAAMGEDQVQLDDAVEAPSRSASQSASADICAPVGPFESSLCEFEANWAAFQSGQRFTPALLHEGRTVGQHEVFANSDLPLARIKTYGFDFDVRQICGGV
jgi:hypothetical protein